ncbi:WD40-repeat-containing domain protein, partial [Ilyonectria destructans]
DFVFDLDITPDSKWLLSVSEDESLIFWDIATGKPHTIVLGHNESVMAVAVAGATNLFATASGDMTVRVWSYQVLE